MKTYKTKKDLKDEIMAKFEKYISEFSEIKEEDKNSMTETSDRTPSQNLSYNLGWVTQLIKWEEDEQKGLKAEVPAAGYKWNNLGGLYDSFYRKYDGYSIKQKQLMLRESVDKIVDIIDELSDEELFEPQGRDWAITAANWPVYKWIHINTVAPFTTFRAKIRKWKREFSET